MASVTEQVAEVLTSALQEYDHPFFTVWSKPGDSPDAITVIINGVEFDVVIFEKGDRD